MVMSSCLDKSMSCSGVALDGKFVTEFASISCHLVAMGVARGSGEEELCVRLFRCLGDSACRSLLK